MRAERDRERERDGQTSLYATVDNFDYLSARSAATAATSAAATAADALTTFVYLVISRYI